MSTTARAVTAALIVGACVALRAQEAALEPSFNPNDAGFGAGDGCGMLQSSNVKSTIVLPDGKILIAGKFESYNGTVRRCCTRLNSDGSLDPTFANPLASYAGTSRAYAMALQPDGKILLAGYFNIGSLPKYLFRLNADGTLDTGFQPAAPNGAVFCIALQPDGKILIGGQFSTCAGIARNAFARLEPNGALDNGFVPQIEFGTTEIYSVSLGLNGKILVGGRSTYFGHALVRRLNADGGSDNTFSQPDFQPVNSDVYSVVQQSDGKVLVGGDFGSTGGTAVNNIARLNSNGSLDNTFLVGTGTDGSIEAMLPLPDGKLLIGGWFSDLAGTANNRIARLNANGTPDTGFSSGAGDFNGGISCLTTSSNDQIMVGGTFLSVNGTGYQSLVRLTGAGAVDQSFALQGGANEDVRSLLIQPDGKVLIAGYFTSYNGRSAAGIARFNADGSPDNTFQPGTGADNWVNSIALQPDGKILIAGVFTNYDGISRPRLARINADGSLDSSFNPGSGPGSEVHTVTVQPDGKILIGGWFTSYNGSPVNRIARLNPDGTLDGSVINTGTGVDQGVYAFALQPDGKIIIAGFFTNYNGTQKTRIGRLNADGTLDTGFAQNIGANNGILACLVLPNGKILIAGAFTSYAGIARNRVARLNADGTLDTGFAPGYGASATVNSLSLQGDGSIVLGGQFTSFNGAARNRVVRIGADGNLDPGFDPGTGADNAVFGTGVRADGKIIIAGYFTSYGGIGRNRVALLNGTPRTGIKLMLEGPYSGGTMNDALRTLPSFPLTEPFTAMGYAETGYVPGATIGSSVLSVTGNNAIVDWAIVEMRPVATPGTVAASRAVLLQRDGDVVDLDGMSTVGFAGLAAGSYCVAVKSRNHLPVMLSATTPVSYGAAVATVDFTLPTTQVYDNDARKIVSGVMVLAAGDVTFNETVGYTGVGNDRDPILTRVGSTTPNATVSGYWREDVNMDGVVKYTGSANDRDIILTNVGSTTPNNTRVATLP